MYEKVFLWINICKCCEKKIWLKKKKKKVKTKQKKVFIVYINIKFEGR